MFDFYGKILHHFIHVWGWSRVRFKRRFISINSWIMKRYDHFLLNWGINQKIISASMNMSHQSLPSLERTFFLPWDHFYVQRTDIKTPSKFLYSRDVLYWIMILVWRFLQVCLLILKAVLFLQNNNPNKVFFKIIYWYFHNLINWTISNGQ